MKYRIGWWFLKLGLRMVGPKGRAICLRNLVAIVRLDAFERIIG